MFGIYAHKWHICDQKNQEDQDNWECQDDQVDQDDRYCQRDQKDVSP